MKFSPFSLRFGACLALGLFLAQMTLPAWIPPAHALYWEDDTDFNSPQDRKERPKGGFFLFNWINSLGKSSRKGKARDLDNRDTGSSVNGGKQALVYTLSGLTGMGLGLAYSSSMSTSNRERANFIGGAVGLCVGLAVGALIMPKDYQVDSAGLPEARFRMAFADDPVLRPIRAAFHTPALQFPLTF